MSVENSEGNIYGEIVDYLDKHGFVVVDHRGQNLVGGADILPVEQPIEFPNVDSLVEGDYSNVASNFRILQDIFDKTKIAKIPVVIEVGGMGSGNDTFSPFNENFGLMDKIENFIDVNVVDARIAPSRDLYVQIGIEEMARVFKEGHRGNVIYLSNVLTNDGVAADISTDAYMNNILQQLRDSLVPKGLVVCHTSRGITGGVKQKHAEKNGFLSRSIHHRFGKVDVLQKV